MCEWSKTCAKRLVRKVFCAKWPVTQTDRFYNYWECNLLQELIAWIGVACKQTTYFIVKRVVLHVCWPWWHVFIQTGDKLGIIYCFLQAKEDWWKGTAKLNQASTRIIIISVEELWVQSFFLLFLIVQEKKNVSSAFRLG